jgi:hypothetical protein
VDITHRQGNQKRQSRAYRPATTTYTAKVGLSDEQWLTLTTEFEKHFCYAAGAEMMMKQFKEHTGHQRIRGMGKAKTLLRCA